MTQLFLFPDRKPTLRPRLPRLLYLNGPAGTGKSTLADRLVDLDAGVYVYSHPLPLWMMADVLLGSDDSDPLDFTLQDVKQSTYQKIGVDQFPSQSIRELLVNLGHFVRSNMGPAWLSQKAREAAIAAFEEGYETVVFPSVRTLEDIELLTDLVPMSDQLMLHLSRPGFEWTGDLGAYILDANLPSQHLSNHGSLEDFISSALSILGVPAHD